MKERSEIDKKDLKSTLENSERLLLESKGISTSTSHSKVEDEKISSKLLLKNEEEEVMDLNEIKRKYDDEDVDYEQDSNDGFESR